MHTYDDETEELARAIVAYARNRIASPQPLDRVAPPNELARRAGQTIAPEGIGWEEALRWVAGLAGFPGEAGGVFVSGGSAGNLSALVTARHAASERRRGRPDRWRFAACDTVHSSVA